MDGFIRISEAQAMAVDGYLNGILIGAVSVCLIWALCAFFKD